VQELVGVAREISSTRAMARTGMGNLLLYFLYEKWSGCMASFRYKNGKQMLNLSCLGSTKWSNQGRA
jgi:hypothetical protein